VDQLLSFIAITTTKCAVSETAWSHLTLQLKKLYV